MLLSLIVCSSLDEMHLNWFTFTILIENIILGSAWYCNVIALCVMCKYDRKHFVCFCSNITVIYITMSLVGYNFFFVPPKK